MAFFDQQFRRDVQRKMSRGFSVPVDTNIIPSDYEVVYVVAKKNNAFNTLPDIPFFSKVSFKNVAKRLQRYGYKVSITAVPFTYVTPPNP